VTSGGAGTVNIPVSVNYGASAGSPLTVTPAQLSFTSQTGVPAPLPPESGTDQQHAHDFQRNGDHFQRRDLAGRESAEWRDYWWAAPPLTSRSK